MLALAWRNIWRARARSAFTAGAIALATFLSLMIYAFAGAAINGFFSSLTAKTGHLVVRVAGYETQQSPEDRLIWDGESLVKKVRALLPEAEVDPVLEFPALIAGEKRSLGGFILGLEKGGRAYREQIEKYLAKGQGFSALDEAVAGAALTRRLAVGTGQTLYIYSPSGEGMGSGVFRVSGLVSLPETRYERAFVAMPLLALQELVAPGGISRIEVSLPKIRRLSDQAAIERAKEILQQGLGAAYEVRTWKELYPALATMIELSKRFLSLYVAIFFGLSGLMLLNTIYLSLVERIREFGLMIALGVDRYRTMRLVLTESFLLAAVGTGAGLVLGLLATWWLSGGFSLPGRLAADYAQFGLPTILYAELHASEVLTTVAFALASSILAALWPAWLAAKLEPAEAMRYTAA